ncbi:MAG: protein kinase [Gemmatales bacterium]
MNPSTNHATLPPTLQNTPNESQVQLQANMTFESLDARFPSTLPDFVPPPPKIQSIGPYRIEAELGRGGMGIVYRARDTRLDRVIALKMILRAEYSNANDLHRFQTEAMAVAKLKHPNIVQVYDVGTEADIPYMALEYIEQGTLTRKTQGKPQEARYAAHLIAAMADGIQHAHEHGILHRDLKPANILIRQRETDSSSGSGTSSSGSASIADVPVISDFGLAKRLDSKELFTQSGMAVGTPNYMSPEQAEGTAQKTGKASDIYGLGAILYELLTGKPPFQGISPIETLMQVIYQEPVPPRQLQPKIPVDLETICMKCLQKDPERRYATAADLAADLRRFLRDEVIAARPAGSVERLVRWCRRHPAVSALTALAVMLLITGTAVASYFAYEADQRAKQLAIEKDSAGRNLQRARTIIREYLTEVEADPALREMLSMPLKQKLLSRAMPMLRELMQEMGDTPELISEQARAQWLLGNIHRLLGQTKEAEAAYRSAIESLEKLHRDNLATLEQIDFLGHSYLNQARLLVDQGSFKSAQAVLLQLEELGKSIMTAHPDSRLPQAMVVNSKVTQAELNRLQGHYAMAGDALKQAEELLTQSEKFDKMNGLTLQKVQLLMEQAQVEVDTGHSNEALNSYRDARHYADLFLKESGVQDDYQELTARIDHQLCRLLETLGQFPKAVELVTGSIEKFNKLIASTPLVHQYQQRLAISYGQRAMIYSRMKKFKEAEADIRMEHKLLEQLMLMNPTYLNKRELARAYGHLGDHYLFQQNHKECEKNYREASRIYAELMPLQPGDTDVRLWYSNMQMSLGNMMLSQARFNDAIKEYEAAHAGFEKLVELCPDITINRVLLGGAAAIWETAICVSAT